MPQLFGPNGQSMQQYLETKEFAGRPKNPKPIVGDAFSDWAGMSKDFLHLPGGGAIQFDTSRLTMADFRRMSEHYQIASSIYVLTFMLHQLDWKLEGDDKKVNDWCAYNLELVWTRLVRSFSSAFTFGFSANAVEWENDSNEGKLRMNKIKDLVPDECDVNWKYVKSSLKSESGLTPAPDVPIFDGIKKRGSIYKVPVENSLWYPLLMRHGNYYGTRLLRTAFQPWFFSSLIHLYQNKYFERFGEPVPIGRAPYTDKVKVGNKSVHGYELMSNILANIRSRSAVVLPNSRSKEGMNDQPEFDYQVEYLESQMRGADFERYLTRLDEEMSLALFTPLLLLRTADAGGFNQGIAHTQVYQWMLNAVSGDWAEYIDKYVLRPMAIYNFGPKAKLPRIKFRKLGTAQQETLRAIVQSLISKDKVMPDIVELGQHIGLSLTEVEEVMEKNPDDAGIHPEQDDDPDAEGDRRSGRPERLKDEDLKPGATTKQITQRIHEQINRVYKLDLFNEWTPAPGFNKQLAAELQANGHPDARRAATAFTGAAITAMTDAARLGTKVFPTPDAMKDYATKILESETEKMYASA
ncbi:portal protein [Gordonia phage Benczkowski14]|uniref:Portal protein n=5 Tax=Demosthenesvirus katyusha TaxID=1982108 RepID=A0A345MCI0_9CAUD|nr:portal protein [Gordonia phage Kvothe]YP_009603285.1 portal protein [Gordonia phage Katyusha]AMS03721.1 portal protein [Gordonia phage Benczkowski14]AXH68201.1 portal protein [Gordonia phage Teatealatte]QBP29569.1 portal protein [Gordonia phage Tredge]AMS03404.1 portal protein [Gordonia phage Katyusha]ANA86076.1 portal protein [Gordonia phage Kvothe]